MSPIISKGTKGLNNTCLECIMTNYNLLFYKVHIKNKVCTGGSSTFRVWGKTPKMRYLQIKYL